MDQKTVLAHLSDWDMHWRVVHLSSFLERVVQSSPGSNGGGRVLKVTGLLHIWVTDSRASAATELQLMWPWTTKPVTLWHWDCIIWKLKKYVFHWCKVCWGRRIFGRDTNIWKSEIWGFIFGKKGKSNHFDPYNVLLAIATNTPTGQCIRYTLLVPSELP